MASVLVLPLALDILLAKEDAIFLGVDFLGVGFLVLRRDSVRDFSVALMPAWAINKAFFKSTKSFFLAMSHHAIADSESHQPMVPLLPSPNLRKPERRHHRKVHQGSSENTYTNPLEP